MWRQTTPLPAFLPNSARSHSLGLDAIPFAVDPPSGERAAARGATFVQTVTARADAGALGGGLLGYARVDGGRDGPPQPPTQDEAQTAPRPSRSRSAPAGGAVTATTRPPGARRRRPACCPVARSTTDRPAGRRPTSGTRRPLSGSAAAPWAFPVVRQPPGVGGSAAERQRQRRGRALAAAQAARAGPP